MRFRDILERLDSEGHLTRVRGHLDPRFEVARLLKQHDGEPVLFEDVGRGSMPVAGNLLSRMDLLAESLGIRPGEWIERLSAAWKSPGPVREGVGEFDYLEPDLDLVPILTHYPKDQGPYVTSGVVFAQRGDRRNLSFHRLSRRGTDRFVGRLVEHRDLDRMYRDARDHGEDLDVAVAVGNRTGVLVAGATSLGPEVYELEIASALEGGIEVTHARTNGTSYPTDSEVVFEGKILHDETAPEGPFVDLTNTYDVVRDQPVFVVDRIAVRKGAVYHALLPGANEHRLLMGAPRTPTIYAALKEAGIDVANVFLTAGGSGWLDAAIAIRKRQEADPRNAIEAAIRGHRSLKKITIVDADVDVTDPNEVNYAVTMYWEAGRELVLRGVKGSSLDPMASPDGIGSKLALDATRPLAVPPERAPKMTKAELDPSP